MSATNVIYLTSKCNFACEYCYEHVNGEQADKLFTLSEVRALANIEEIIANEPDPDDQTMIVLFGGEPTLNWEVCKKVVLRGYELKKNIYFCLSTNGWRFRDPLFCESYIKLSNRINRQIGLDLSFDGIGNYRRKLRNGNSTTEGMYTVFKNLAKYNIKFNLRYTVHTGNIDYAAKDLANIDRIFKPAKLVLSFDNNHLDLNKVTKVKSDIREQYINGCIAHPICELVCDICQKCPKTKGMSYWSESGNIRNIAKYDNAKSFEDF